MLPIAAFLYTTAMAGIDVIAMVLLNLSHGKTAGWFVLPFTMALYSIQPFLFNCALSFEGMGLINALWDSTSTVFIAIIGVLLFGEKINRIQWMGVAVCAVGIALLGVKE